MHAIHATFLLVAVSLSAHAGLKQWNGGDDAWTNPNAWTPAGVPTTNDNVWAHSGVITLAGASGAAASIVITNSAALVVNNPGYSLQVLHGAAISGNLTELQIQDGALEVGGTLTLQNHPTMYLFAGVLAAEVFDPRGGSFEWLGGTLRVTGGLYLSSGQPFSNLTIAAGRILETTSDYGASLFVGSSGTLSLMGGAINCDAFSNDTAGTFAFNDGTLTVNGGGLDWGTNGLRLEGDLPTHEPALVLNGFYYPLVYLAFPSGVALAPSNNRQAALSLTGGTVLTAPGSIAGGTGSTASMTLAGGSSWKPSTLTVGGSGQGTLNIGGGSSVSQSSQVSVGVNSTATGTVTVDGAGSSWESYSQTQFGVSGIATLHVTGGGSVTFDNQSTDTQFALNAGSKASITVAGAGSQFQVLYGANEHALNFAASGQAAMTVSAGASVAWNEFVQVAAAAGGRGDIVVTGAGSTWNLNYDLWLGSYGTGTVQVLNGGTMNTPTAKLGEWSGAVGSATVSGAGSVWNAGGYSTIGLEFLLGRYGTGLLTVENGGVVHSSGSSELGNYPGSRGYATVAGAGSLWDIGGELMIGSSQANVIAALAVTNAGLVTVSDTAYLYAGSSIHLGGGVQGSGTLAANQLNCSGGNLTGDNQGILCLNALSGQPATWTIPANLRIGYTNGGAAANWTLGTGQNLNVAGKLSLGYDKSATFSQSAGALQSQGFALGDAAGGNGTYTLSNGTLNATTGLIGYRGTGQLAIEGGAATFLNGLYVADNAGSQGTLSLDRGTLTAQTLFVGQSSQGACSQTGGTNATLSDCYVGYWPAGVGTASLSGGTHSVAGNTYIGGNHEGTTSDGGTGQYTVSAGTLAVGNTLYVGHDGSGTLLVTNSGQVNAGTVVVSQYAGSRGQATLDGTNAVWVVTNNLTVGNAGSGNRLTVNSGTLTVSGAAWVSASAGASNNTLTVAGGTLVMTNTTYTGNLFVNCGTVVLSAGRLEVNALYLTNACARFIHTGGTFVGIVYADPTLDADGDGMPNLWEEAHGLDPYNPNGADGASGDPDHDGFTNLQEYFADTDPKNAASYFRITSVVDLPPLTVTFLSSSNRVYSLCCATNLSTAPWTVRTNQSNIVGTGGSMSLRDTNAAAASFYRVRVSLP